MRLILLCLLLLASAYSSRTQTIGTPPFAVRLGLTGDACESSEECEGGRKCAPRNTVNVESCEGREGCRCKLDDPKECQKNKDCDEGEVCATSNKNSDGSTCFSAAAVDQDETLTAVDEPGALQASPTASDGVCIGLDALAHLPALALVFEHHPLANVLCDEHGSCATPGHIVLFNDKPMMMRSYCEIASCEPKVMRVNSPRYTRGLRIPSRTVALRYTVLAARYETAAEESVLGAAVRVGL